MSEQRLNSMALLSIERNEAESFLLNDVVDRFATADRRITLH